MDEYTRLKISIGNKHISVLRFFEREDLLKSAPKEYLEQQKGNRQNRGW